MCWLGKQKKERKERERRDKDERTARAEAHGYPVKEEKEAWIQT